MAKKGVGKKVSRPAGVRGQFKVVDPRLKKDTRAKKFASSKKGKGRNSRQPKGRAGGKGKGGKR